MRPHCNIPSSVARRSDVGSAFTLVEFLAVLAIITILALIVLENVLEKVKRAQQEAEVQNLRNIATALTQSVVRVQAVPCDTNWVPQIATELGLAEHRIGQNRLGNNRALYVDSSFRIGTNIAGTYKGAPTGLPFTQNVLGSQAIRNARHDTTRPNAPTRPGRRACRCGAPRNTAPAGFPRRCHPRGK